MISTLPNSVRSSVLHRSRFVCNFCNLWLKLCWLFPFSSCETWIPKILTGLCSHFSCNGLPLLFFNFPNQSRTMIGQMAIAIALLGFNDLGSSVTPTFLSRNRFCLQLSPHRPKMNKTSMREVLKNCEIAFHWTSNHAILGLQGA